MEGWAGPSNDSHILSMKLQINLTLQPFKACPWGRLGSGGRTCVYADARRAAAANPPASPPHTTLSVAATARALAMSDAVKLSKVFLDVP